MDRTTPSPGEIRDATERAIAAADEHVAAAIAAARSGAAVRFVDVFGALDRAGRVVHAAWGRAGFLRSVAHDPSVREAADEANTRVVSWRGALPARPDLAAAVRAAADVVLHDAELDADGRAYVARWQRDIRLAGDGLDDAARAGLQADRDRLVAIESAFVRNLMRPLHLEIPVAALDDLPRPLLEQLAPGPASETRLLPLTDGTVTMVLESAPDRDLRERVDRTWQARGVPDNRDLLDEAIQLRRRVAGTLGYPSWRALRAEAFALGSTEAIDAFIDETAARLAPVARRDVEAMRAAISDASGAEPGAALASWDWRYADARQRASLGIDPSVVREFLSFEAVLSGLRALAEEVFGVRFVDRPERRGWHPDVRAFDLVDRDDGRQIAALFVDPYERPGKEDTPFADVLDPGEADEGPDGGRSRVLVLSTGASAPSADTPSLLGARDLDAVFHEFGHILDFTFDRSRFAPMQFERWIPMDWIEGPSQFLGRWGSLPRILGRYARHHRTGEPIPPAMIEAIGRQDSLNAAFKALRLLAMGVTDAALHGPSPMTVDDADRLAAGVLGIDRPDGTCFAATLVHFAVGYEAAVYGFVWSQILRDDLLGRFEREGLTSPVVGAAYRSALLERAWTSDPIDAVRVFLGRDWSTDAFIERLTAGA